MSYFLIVFGGTIICYTVVAYYFGLPLPSDFFPLGFFEEKSGGQFYKVVPSDEPDKGPWLVVVFGVALILLGLYVKYTRHR